MPTRETVRSLQGHIYAIDDNPDILKHLTGVLQRYGLTVESYLDAESFLKESIEVAPAVVVLDMDLPGINGLATHERLLQSGRQTPIVYLSGRSDHQQIIDAHKLGANAFLLKPFSIAQLIDAIADALAKDEERLSHQVAAADAKSVWSGFTEREKEVCSLILSGHSNLEIATMLDVRADTIKKHRARILEKAGASKLADLLAFFKGHI